MADVWPVTLCGILMDGTTPDTEGVRWARAELNGWDSAPVLIADDDLTGRHGGYGPSRLYGARVLSLSGMAYCPNMATAERVRDRLHTMPGPSASGDLIVHMAVPKSLEVVMGGEPRSSWPLDLPKPWVRFTVPLVALDPFKRATTARTVTVGSGGSVSATSLGTAASDMVVTVTSAGTVQLSAGGLTLRTSSLPVGAVIDTGAATVVDGSGADLFGSVLVAQFPAVPAGGGSISQAGTAGLSITYHDAYA